VFVKGKKRQGYPLVSTALSQLCDVWERHLSPFLGLKPAVSGNRW